MPVTIDFENARSRVVGLRPEDRRQLQRLVSFRDKALPPASIQTLIKGFTTKLKRRRGIEIEHQMFVTRLAGQMTELGYDPAQLTRRLYANALYNRGLWDGWTSLIASDGSFGSGLVDHVTRALTLRMGLPPPTIVDRRRPPPQPQNVWVPSPPPLFDFQAEALAAWLHAGGRGVVDLPPRAGKTRIMVAAVQALRLPTLLVVPKIALVEQTVDRFLELGFRAGDVIGVTGGVSSLSKKKQRALARALVWVTTPGTAAGRKGTDGARSGMPGIESRAVLILDEFHHAAADTYQSISIAARNAYYRLGATGTFHRSDGADLKMLSVLSRAIYSRSVEAMIALGRLVPGVVGMFRVPGGPVTAQDGTAYGVGISRHDERNRLVIQAARLLAHHGKRVLVLTKEVEHARQIAAGIPGAEQVDGSNNQEVRPALQRLEEGTLRVLVGTNVIGEGVDVPNADALVYAAGGRSPNRVVQDFYRVLTGGIAGKTHGLIVDFADDHHPALMRHAAQRLALYRRCFKATVHGPGELEAFVRLAV